MQILELERQTGLDRSTIRFYEREGFLKPQRRENGYRDYSDSDCENLLKIKLLRQLGLELNTIRALQEGEQDFSAAMDAQIQSLQAQILTAQQSRNLCIAIRSEVTDYRKLDARHYLQLLGQMQQQGSTDVYPKKVPEFSIPVQVHPVRRFVARWLDWVILITLVEILLYMILRIRPLASGFSGSLLSFGVRLAAIPIEAAFLHFWGATPGKWIMGIRLEHYRGGRIPYSSTLERSFGVFWSGQGARIPLLSEWLQFRHYCLYTGKRIALFASAKKEPPQELEWDTREWEIVYTDREGKRTISIVCALILLLGMNVFLMLDCMKPTYRSWELTVAQFAENYNDYMAMTNPNAEKMLPNGTWPVRPENSFVIYFDGTPEEEDKPYTFQTENGFIREITYENKYQDIFYMYPLPQDAIRTACIALQSQTGVWIWNVSEFEKLLQDHQSDAKGTLQYQNIEVHWTSEASNCVLTPSGYFTENKDLTGDVAIYWRIIIHEKE